MKILFNIALIMSLGLFTACTTSTPTVEDGAKATVETKSETKIADKVADKAVTLAKSAAIGAATKKAQELASKKKK